MEDEAWAQIQEFPNYVVSNYGRIFNVKYESYMKTSYTPFGHMKVNLTRDGVRYTRSVARLTALAFVEPPSLMCDRVIVLNGDLSDMRANNLAWRPRHVGWLYTRQLKDYEQGRIPRHYLNLRVLERNSDEIYESIVLAGITNGLLFKDIWRSTFTQTPVLPLGQVYEVIGGIKE